MATRRTASLSALLVAVAIALPAAPALAWPKLRFPVRMPVTEPILVADANDAQPPAVAVAELGPARCVVHEIRASNDKGGIDPALAPLEAKLKRPPFSSWDTFKLLARHEAALDAKKLEKLKLVTGGKMGLLFRDRIKARGSKARVRISITVDNTGGQRIVESTMVLDSGDDSVIGGWPYDSGTYLIALSCTIQ